VRSLEGRGFRGHAPRGAPPKLIDPDLGIIAGAPQITPNHSPNDSLQIFCVRVVKFNLPPDAERGSVNLLFGGGGPSSVLRWNLVRGGGSRLRLRGRDIPLVGFWLVIHERAKEELACAECGRDIGRVLPVNRYRVVGDRRRSD
jgi:hypothetical protein